MQAPKINLNSKGLQLSKEQSRLVAIVTAATVITVFCLMSSKALVSKAAYQNRVISARNASAKQLKTDISSATALANQYNNVFIGNNPENIIGGKNTEDVNAMPPDGNNGRIVLDALPTVYDFPALLTSMSKILSTDGIGSPSIGGSDQSTTFSSTPSGTPQPTAINLTVSGSGRYSDTQKLVEDLERSIRPYDITKLTLTGDQNSQTINLTMTTYYQQAKTLNITAKEIR